MSQRFFRCDPNDYKCYLRTRRCGLVKTWMKRVHRGELIQCHQNVTAPKLNVFDKGIDPSKYVIIPFRRSLASTLGFQHITVLTSVAYTLQRQKHLIRSCLRERLCNSSAIVITSKWLKHVMHIWAKVSAAPGYMDHINKAYRVVHAFVIFLVWPIQVPFLSFL